MHTLLFFLLQTGRQGLKAVLVEAFSFDANLLRFNVGLRMDSDRYQPDEITLYGGDASGALTTDRRLQNHLR